MGQARDDPRDGIIPARAGFTVTEAMSWMADSGSSPLARGLRASPTAGRSSWGIIPARAGFTWWSGYYEKTDEGSSPLARGLLPEPEEGVILIGIIPARAGFTLGGRQSHPRNQDHPRSRGVYGPIIGTARPAMGSSPLARGLQVGPALCWAGTRIIPARAGFTTPGHNREGDRRDHPRSRGVYSKSFLASTSPSGSSPLARGLHHGRIPRRSAGRIIPARAGFTAHHHPRPRRPADHPRSRGVYGVACASGGSSPLARGLRSARPPRGLTPRIIPARAGFTRRRRASRSYVWDHPRSRGVYTATASRRRRTPGSSPLARGLPTCGIEDADRLRIIPARAGFTPRPRRRHRLFRDHPRSRGVYITRTIGPGGSPGSSPLARGLRIAVSKPTERERIIPARAGFTWTSTAVRESRWDHPRSRGVYSTPTTRTSTRNGSSPLARGLRAADAASLGGEGIIPARAGFTRGARHPPRDERGSSPLARGLHDEQLRLEERGRIIPARAGFTAPSYKSRR